ncbi:ANTAR domain-containing protein [Kribbella amoyensis]|uniref:ANTAR domain-containing protein n=1 Tax=Kribbella amoyensis TaxID=996641 RepID=A0A561BVV5_9ACTN|nr:GAF and ANTAR domain-containing protein [Kribbella amoyensis]TWD83034.1 ANTAR domain-containing protein [Kribbella amoyensis]
MSRDEEQRSSPAAQRFADLRLQLHALPGVAETVEAVVAFAVAELDSVQAGVVLADDAGRPAPAAVTDPVVLELYRAQLKAGEGPMLTAFTEGETVRVPDVATATTWPVWQGAALSTGLRSMLHIPLRAGDLVVGVLSLYSTKTDAFSTDAASESVLATYAEIAVDDAQAEQELVKRVKSEQLLGTATGILMERHDLTSSAADAVLHQYAEETDTSPRDVAEEIISASEPPAEASEEDELSN